MTLILLAIALAVAAWIAAAAVIKFGRGLSFRQALLYAPLKALWRIDGRAAAPARDAAAPVIYVVSHQSRLDPALMLCLLPDDTLHILDPKTASSTWMEPFRGLARTIAFRAEHVFVSRRLVRHLKGKGRLAVYLPGVVEPDRKQMRLYRAVARIALRAGASIVPLVVDDARHSRFSLDTPERAPRRWLPKLRVVALPAASMDELMADRGFGPTTATNALFDHLADARFDAANLRRTLFSALRDAAALFGQSQVAVEDPLTGSMTYRRLLMGARVLARRFATISERGEAVGVLLPNANVVAVTFFALQSAGRVAAMLNYSAGPANVASAVRTARMRTVVSSHAFIEKAGLEDVSAAVEKAGATILWLENLRTEVSALEKVSAALFHNRAVTASYPDEAAAILFTSGSEGAPKGVMLSHTNLLANIAQVAARIDFSPKDVLFNVLPVFHCFGLTGGAILPLLSGVRLYFYPSPLHYKLIPKTVAKVRPTVMLGTDTFLSGYAATAKKGDFASLRMVVAGAEAVKPETEKVWRERFGAQILEGYGMTEGAPVVAVNSHCHGKVGTVGRLLPHIRVRLEPVEGLPDGGRLWLSGPNVMLGYLTADRAGELQPPAGGWHDSGDVVAIDREGFITIKGRVKRFAKIAGEMVSLGAVEMLVQALWPEEHHAAISVPDKRKGERIVLVTTAREAEPKALRDFGKKKGASNLMVPGEIVKVSEIPALGSGKTDYPKTRKIVLDKLGEKDAA